MGESDEANKEKVVQLEEAEHSAVSRIQELEVANEALSQKVRLQRNVVGGKTDQTFLHNLNRASLFWKANARVSLKLLGITRYTD